MMLEVTNIEKLGFDPSNVWEISTRRREDNTGYAAPFPLWWKKYELSGNGIVIGEDLYQRELIQEKLSGLCNITALVSIDISGSDIKADICKEDLPCRADFILCMAVLEHTFDPAGAFRRMAKALLPNGLLSISVPINGFKQHRRPFDCYRFLEDSLGGFALMSSLDLLDYTSCGKEWCAIYRKPS